MLFSEPKIPQRAVAEQTRDARFGFSALQRAENSSVPVAVDKLAEQRSVSVLFSEPKIPHSFRFQRGSDFLEVSVLFSEPKIPHYDTDGADVWLRGFSALQRAENSSFSMRFEPESRIRVSVLFSEPKIPQRNNRAQQRSSGDVSVLFSEPKIPQL